MPYSGTLLDGNFEQFFRLVAGGPPPRVLDIGAGAGKYAKLIRQIRPDAHLTAVEVERRYIQHFSLNGLYNTVLEMPGQMLMRNIEATYDLVIMGDVIEHMPKSEGVDLLNFLVYRSAWLWLQFPIRYLQNALDGIESEAHVSIWDYDDFVNLDTMFVAEGALVAAGIAGYRTAPPEYDMVREVFLNKTTRLGVSTARQLQAQYNLDTFFETGIWYANSTAWAAEYFERVYTVDLDPYLVMRARRRFLRQPHVKVMEGTSVAALEKVAPHLPKSTLFYLDAHYIKDKQSMGDPNHTPLLEELRLALPTGGVVLIDDARLIVERDSDYPYYPTLDAIEALAGEYGYSARVMRDGSDMIAVVPLGKEA